MSWLAPRLRERIQIRKAVQSPNEETGGFNRSYERLLTAWASIKPLAYKNSNLKYVRNVQLANDATHTFEIRWASLLTINTAFGDGFISSFDSVIDILSIKSNYFIFMEQGVNDGLYWEGPYSKAFSTCFNVYYGIEEAKGRLFRIIGAGRADERKEYVKVIATEMEEMGSGLSL